jgi:hypothetical protein
MRSTLLHAICAAFACLAIFASPTFASLPESTMTPATQVAPAYQTLAFTNSLTSGEMKLLLHKGLSVGVASKVIRVQSQIARTPLVSQMEAALGRRYAGVWYTEATAKLHVGVTSDSSLQTARNVVSGFGLGADVEETPVDSTWSQLISAQRHWDLRLAGLLRADKAETAINPEQNAVVIRLGSSVALPERRLIRKAAGRAPTKVDVIIARLPEIHIVPDKTTSCAKFEAGKANCGKTITAGVTIENADEEICTAGPLMLTKDNSKETLETFLLTAGHCSSSIGEKWYAFDHGEADKKKEIGTVADLVDDKAADIEAIKVTNPGQWLEAGNTPALAVMAEWFSATEPSESVPVSGELAPPVFGNPNCKEGQTSGETCGTIKDLHVTVGETENLVEDEGAKSEKGDSGGPWYTTTSGVGLRLEGTTVGHDEETGNGIYLPLSAAYSALAELGLELLTTSNETRAACPMMD